eukprot:scaffold83_cov181-Amphora_coffeaeformis.AAC.11
MNEAKQIIRKNKKESFHKVLPWLAFAVLYSVTVAWWTTPSQQQKETINDLDILGSSQGLPKPSSGSDSDSNSEWCGDWIPRGSLGHPHYDETKEVLSAVQPNKSSSIDNKMPSCHKQSTVGTLYEPDATKLFCGPQFFMFDHDTDDRDNTSTTGTHRRRPPARVALDLQRRRHGTSKTQQQQQQQQPEYSIISPSHPVASVLNETAPLLCQHTIGAWEVIFILDASWDDSLQVLKNILVSPQCLSSSLVRARVLVTTMSIFETSSDNLGMTLAQPSHFYIEVQSDMYLQRRGWNRDLARPVLEYNDVFSVSGRCGHSQGPSRGHMLGRCGPNVEHMDERLEKKTAHSFYVTATNNRGPLLYRADALRELKYYDEVHFFLGNDDHDLSRRAAWKGWYASYKYTPFYAPLNKSPGRNKEYVKHIPESAKVEERAHNVYREKLRKSSNSCSDPMVQGFPPYALKQHSERQLSPNFTIHDPLPAVLPPIFRLSSSEKRL